MGVVVPGLRVQAWDDDWPAGDDFMGEDITDTNGQYEIAYADVHWDTAGVDFYSGRPDIYITVEIRNARDKWVRLGKSQVFKDHDLSTDLQIDLDVEITPSIQKTIPFIPGQHGFHFINDFILKPDILGLNLGKWEMGFCGGMCAGALQRFIQHLPIPADTVTPADDSPLFEELLARQIRSFPVDLLPVLYDWQSAPDVSNPWRKISIAERTKAEWPKLKRELDADRPTILILIRSDGYLGNPTRNHQVLAIGYTFHPATKDLTITEYDPNRPNKEYTLSMSLGLPDGSLYLKDSASRKTRGFLLNPAGPFASR
jgi:hypothetical protein